MKNRLECTNRNCRWTGLISDMKQVQDPEFSFASNNVCPMCECDSYYELEDCVQCDRVDHINQLINLIANHGCKLFNHKGTISNMEKDKNGKIWFVDYYTRRRIYVACQGNWSGFTSGGTLKALVQHYFYEYIKTGKKINIQALAAPDFYKDGGNVWGYDLDEAKKMRELAAKLPCVAVPEGVVI